MSYPTSGCLLTYMYLTQQLHALGLVVESTCCCRKFLYTDAGIPRAGLRVVGISVCTTVRTII